MMRAVSILRNRAARATFVSLGLLACERPLAPENYRGEVIFQARGIVESASSGDSWRELRPVIAFVTPADLELVDSISVRPTDASGISGEFTLELYDVPPADTFIDFEQHPEWGKIAIGLIAAVPSDHPARLINRHTEWSNFPCSPGESCPCSEEQAPRTVDYSFKAAQYHEVLCCPDYSSADEACEVASSEGDASVKDEPVLPVDAVVQDFTMFYLEHDAPAGSELARYLFHSDAGLRAGYHLLKVTPLPELVDIQPDFHYEVVGTEHVALKFKRGVLPWGVNL